MTDVPLHQHWQNVYVKRWLIVLTAATAGVVAWWFSSIVTPIYEAKTTFYLAGNAATQSFVGASPDEPPMPLLPIPEEKAASLDIGILRGREIRAQIAEQFEMEYGEIQKRVHATVSGEFMINVFVRSPDPEQAAMVANAVPGIYAEFHEQSMRERTEASVATLRQHHENLRARRQELKAQLSETQNQSLSTADAVALNALQAERARARVEASSLQAEIHQADARLRNLEASLSREAGFYSTDSTVETTNSLNRMLDRLLELRIELASATDGPASPRRKAIEGQISEIEAAMVGERRRLAEASAKPRGSLHEELRLQLALTRATRAGLTAARDATLARIPSASERFVEVLSASSELEETKASLIRVDQQIVTVEENLAAAILQSDNATPPLVIVERAVPPTRPAFPLPVVNIFTAVLCGVVFGIYYALFVAHAERGRQQRQSAKTETPLFTRKELELLRIRDKNSASPNDEGRQHV